EQTSLIDHRAKRCILGKQQRRGRGHLNLVGLLTDLQLEVEAEFLLEFKRNAGAGFRLETRQRAGDLVIAYVKQRNRVIPSLISRGRANVARRGPPRSDRRSGNHTACRV